MRKVHQWKRNEHIKQGNYKLKHIIDSRLRGNDNQQA
jgi:hypothetical protein